MKETFRIWFLVFSIFVVILIIIIIYFAFGFTSRKQKHSHAITNCQKYLKFEKKRCLHILKPSENSSGRIWSGEQAKFGQFPHMARIITYTANRKLILCAGTLISKDFVMTAGHCADKVSKRGATITLGITNWIQLQCAEEFRNKAVYFYNSEKYKLLHDIGLIKLDREVEFDWYMRPICLNPYPDIELKEMTATGWGTTEKLLISTWLKWIHILPMPESECEEKFPHRYFQTNYICAGHPIEHRDICEGDSGGPLQMPLKSENNYTYVQVGVSSYGVSCQVPGQARTVGIYTKVAFYIQWIEHVVWS